MLEQLIAAPSISSVNPEFDGGNLAVLEPLAHWLADCGFKVEWMPLPGHEGKANLLATLGQGPGGLVLAGHTDTVPCNEELWTHNPFQLSERDGKLYGLGTCDMKGFFALIMEAVRELQAKDLKAPLIILATADEESTMDGAKLLMEQGKPQARYAIIGEPTGLRPVNAHKGILMEAIHLQGRAGHSSDPSLGINALEWMHKVIGELINWREQMQREYRDENFVVPFPTLNLGHICGGDNPNRICPACELHIDLRSLPGMQLEQLREQMQQRIARVLQGSGVKFKIRPLFTGIEAMATPTQSALVHAATEMTGHQPESVAFGTEGPFMSALGMETIILGPGNIAQAHQPDEYIELASLQPTVELLKGMIERFCLKG